jgi:hypothetical protein
LNISSNRWSFRPEIGMSKAIDLWTLEAAVSAKLFTDNTNFFNGGTGEQDRLYAVRGRAIYGFASGFWASIDATKFAGGRSTISGTLSNDLQQNWRLGVTLALPVHARNSVKLCASSGVSARTGDNFDLLGTAWQFRWGGGM